MDDKLKELEAIVGPEFMDRLKTAAEKAEARNKALAWSMEDIEAEEACVCKYCGRCVLAGPPCCYDNLYALYQKTYGEVLWLRKIQGKQAKPSKSIS